MGGSWGIVVGEANTVFIAMTVSGTTITMGTQVANSLWGNPSGFSVKCIYLGSSQVVFGGGLQGGGGAYTVVATVSGTTISQGSSVNLSVSVGGTTQPFEFRALDLSHYVVYISSGSSSVLNFYSVSGTTITNLSAINGLSVPVVGNTVAQSPIIQAFNLQNIVLLTWNGTQIQKTIINVNAGYTTSVVSS